MGLFVHQLRSYGSLKVLVYCKIRFSDFKTANYMTDSRKEFRDLAENAEFSYSHPRVLWLPNFTMISK